MAKVYGTPMQDFKLGEALARLYIASQEVSMTHSDMACQGMEDANTFMKNGFNSIQDNPKENPNGYFVSVD